jgi:hypothetical protein
MLRNINLLRRIAAVLLVSVSTVSCVTETIESPAMKFQDAAVISVQDPYIHVTMGATFAWLPEAVHYYQDERLKDAPVKGLIEKEIVKNILAKELIFVDSLSQARYAIAYTAALESALDDTAIIRRFGLMPGYAQTPENDSNVEKGSLIVYVFENKTNDIVWRSAAQVNVAFDTPMEQRKQRVERVLAEMFMSFTVTE